MEDFVKTQLKIAQLFDFRQKLPHIWLFQRVVEEIGFPHPFSRTGLKSLSASLESLSRFFPGETGEKVPLRG